MNLFQGRRHQDWMQHLFNKWKAQLMSLFFQVKFSDLHSLHSHSDTTPLSTYERKELDNWTLDEALGVLSSLWFYLTSSEIPIQLSRFGESYILLQKNNNNNNNKREKGRFDAINPSLLCQMLTPELLKYTNLCLCSSGP